jgi:beta-phosphoglucomutase
MPSIAAIVFDFDGVLANSEPLHMRTFQEVLGELGIPLDRDEYYERYLGFDDVGALRAIAAARGFDWDDRQIAALIERKTVIFDDLIASAEVLYPNAAACVERLAARFPLGIASGALRHEITSVLESSGLARHFRFVVAAGDTPRSKPAPDPYHRAAGLHGLPPAACVAIEDSRWGLESARTAGLRCVGITNTYPANELTTAERVIDSLDEFTEDLILSLNGTGGRTLNPNPEPEP